MSRPLTESSTILVVSGDAKIRETATDLLERGGHRVLAAATGEQGLGMALTILPDLILVDDHLPTMDSLEMVERLKVGVTPRRIPLVVLASGTADRANELIQAGCLASISKPIEPLDFLRLVARILSVTPRKDRHGRP